MRNNIKKWLAALVALAASGLQPTSVSADDRYFMVIFAYQGTPNLPRTSHSFATFVRVPEKDGKLDLPRLESHTISWITSPEKFGLLRPPAPGINLSLQESLQWAINNNAAVTAFGPYQIQKELYDGAIAQLNRLNSGTVAYKATDRLLRRKTAVNCFHAISDIVDGPLLETGAAYGVPASAMVRDHLARWIIDQKTTHRALIAPLGLDKHTITYRD